MKTIFDFILLAIGCAFAFVAIFGAICIVVSLMKEMIADFTKKGEKENEQD